MSKETQENKGSNKDKKGYSTAELDKLFAKLTDEQKRNLVIAGK